MPVKRQKIEKRSTNCIHLLLLLIVTPLALSACGPGFRALDESQEKLSFGPKFVDTNLVGTFSATTNRDLTWEGSTNSATYYEVMNRLSELDRRAPSVKLKTNLRKFVDAEISTAKSTETELTTGNYFQLLVSRQQAGAVQKLTTMKAELQAGVEKIISKISTWQFAQLSVNQPISPLVVKIFADLDNLVIWMKSENMNPSLIQALQEYSGLKNSILPKVNSMDTDNNLGSLAQKMIDLTTSLKVTLSQTVTQELNSALKLGQMINQIRNDEDALAALVFVWRMLPANERYATFSVGNKDLADLFRDSSNSDLDCFAGIRSCGLINYGKKELFILPGIQDKGVAIIRTDLNIQGVTRMRTKIVDLINSKTKDLAATAPAMIREKFGAATAILDLMIADFSGTMASRLQKQNLRESSLNSRAFRVSESQNLFQLTQPQVLGHTLSSRSAVAGFLPTLLRYSGQTSAVKESLFLGSISEAAGEQLNTTNTPLFPLSADFQVKTLSEALESNARLLSGIRNDPAFDSLQRVFDLSAQTLFTETQSDFLKNMKIFPKGALAAIVLGRISKLLEVIKQDNSPVFLLSTKGNIYWADKYKSGSSTPATGAVTAGGIVERVNGSRKLTVKSADVARMLSALSQFVEAMNGIDSLVAEYADAATLKEGRDNARMLSVAFANYLASLRRADGLISHEVDYSKDQEISNEAHLLDQALTIRALMDARRALGIEIYQWEAVDTYYALNAKMFDARTGFYKSHLQTPVSNQALPEFLNILTGIMSVQSVLPESSQAQFKMIFAPWITSVEQLNFQ